MSISFTAMENALLATGLYEITEDTRLYAELKAYDAGLQILHDRLGTLLRETFVLTAESCGLEAREALFGLNIGACSREERRRLLCMRGAVDVNFISRQAFLDILESAGIQASVTESPGTQQITVQVLSAADGQTREETEQAVLEYAPAHADCTVVFANETG